MVKDHEYEIEGLGIRAFHKYRNVWAPKRNQELPLGIDGAVVVIQKGKVKKVTVGTAPGGDIQKGFRELIKAGGKIVAKCKADVERDGPAGSEIACIYKLSVPRNPLAENAFKRIKEGVKEQEKALKACGKLPNITVKLEDVTKKNDAKGGKKAKPQDQAEADKVLEPKPSTSGLKVEKAASSLAILKKNDQQITSGTSNCSEKRKKSQSKEGSSMKKKCPETPSSSGTSNDDQIQLDEKDIGCISQTVGSNWKILGSQLGLSSVLLTNIEESSNKPYSTSVFDMLVKWRAVEKNNATLGSFIQAMKKCPTVHFQHPDLDNTITEIREKYRLNTCKANGQGDAEHCISEMSTRNGKDIDKERKTYEDSQRKEFVFNSGPKCQFLDADGHVETVTQVQAKALVAERVCLIKGPKGTGTGFRVGDRFIMTAAHVIGQFVPMQGASPDTSCHAEFNFTDEAEPRKIFYFKEVVYRNMELDVAVIELFFDNGQPLPPCFSLFAPPVFDRPFFLIGHPHGNPMEINTVTKPVNLDVTKNQICMSYLRDKSMHITGMDYVSKPPWIEPISSNYLFLCKFTHGGSGSPGFFVIGRDIYVTTILLAGFPWWYYENRYVNLKSLWSENECIEIGANMNSVYFDMQQSNPNLCQELFGRSLFLQ